MKNLVVEPGQADRFPRADPPAIRPVAAGRVGGGPTAPGFVSLFEAVEALRNPGAVIALVGCLLAGLLLGGFLSTLGGHSGLFLTVLGALCFAVASATGVNAAGVLLMAQARGAPPRGVQNAIVDGMICVPKCVVLFLALTLVAAAVFVVLTFAYFICKIPLFGPMAFVVVFPVSVVVGGSTFCGLSLCMLLALPAIWEGASLSAAIAQALAVARSRLVETLLLMAALGALTLAVGCVVFGVLLAGMLPMLSLSATLFGSDAVSGFVAWLPGPVGVAYPAIGRGSGGDHAIAIAIGGGLLGSLAGSLVLTVPVLGLNLIYLRVTQGGRIVATEAGTESDQGRAPRSTIDRASSTIPRSVFAPAIPLRAEMEGRLPLSSRCPHCLSSIASDDVFCGICGYKLG